MKPRPANPTPSTAKLAPRKPSSRKPAKRSPVRNQKPSKRSPPRTTPATTPQTVSIPDARALYLDGLAINPGPDTASPASVLGLINTLGFVQIDSINIVERAHHHILWSRMPTYRPSLLDELHKGGHVFEHWTHDASLIPASSFPHWKHRFDRVVWDGWIRQKIGRGGATIVEQVRARVERDGPLMARDFEHPGRKSGPWWDWKPAKAALEYLWRSGRLAVAGRDGFEKIYDLTERVLPGVHAIEQPPRDVHVDWLCRGALDRLGIATARELEQFWAMADRTEIHAWCSAGLASGELVAVRVDGDDRPALSYAFADWKDRAKRAAGRLAHPHDPATKVRVLSPFDPIVRDRQRCSRLFGFDYRFEAFVPEPKRKFGYYVLPVMHGDRFVARLDPKLDRANAVLLIRALWWEPGPRPAPLRRALIRAVERYAEFLGARRVDWPAEI